MKLYLLNSIRNYSGSQYFVYLILFFFAGCGSEHMNAGKIYFQERQYEKAEAQFKAQLAIYPQNPDAIWWLGLTAAQQQQYDNACKYFDKIKKFAPEKQELVKEKAFLWGVYHNAGLVASKNEDWALAKQRFYTAIEFEPESVSTYINIAQSWLEVGEEDSGVYYYKKAIEVAPKNADIHKNLGIYYIGKKDYENAILSLNNALALKPNNTDILYRLGIAYYFAEHYEDARNRFTEIIQQDSTYADAYFNLSTVLIKEGKLEDAKNILNKYISFNQDDEAALVNMASVCLSLKEYQEAVNIYNSLIEANPSSFEYYEGRAHAYWYLGKKQESNTDLKKAQELKKQK